MSDPAQIAATVARGAAVRTQLTALRGTDATIGPLGADLADLHEASAQVQALLETLLTTPPAERDTLADTLAALLVELAHLRWHAASAAPYLEALAEALDAD
jgi:hypothetical protein